MSQHVTISASADLPALVDRASAALVNARSAAEVLEAKELAGAAYDEAKRLGRIARAKKAHDDLLAAVLRSQADAAEIEAGAKRRLADEYKAGQERGEIAKSGDTLRRGPGVPNENAGKATAADVRISRKEVHEGRLIRDAETNDPGVVRRSLDEMVANGEEPTKAKLQRAISDAAGRTPPATRKREPGEAYTRFLALADGLDGVTAAEIIEAAGAKRSMLASRAQAIAEVMEQILAVME